MTDAAPVAAPRSNRDRVHPIEPAPEFARLRAESPVLKVQRQFPDGSLMTMWMITGYRRCGRC